MLLVRHRLSLLREPPRQALWHEHARVTAPLPPRPPYTLPPPRWRWLRSACAPGRAPRGPLPGIGEEQGIGQMQEQSTHHRDHHAKASTAEISVTNWAASDERKCDWLYSCAAKVCFLVSGLSGV